VIDYDRLLVTVRTGMSTGGDVALMSALVGGVAEAKVLRPSSLITLVEAFTELFEA
jgi:hypothetical protein